MGWDGYIYLRSLVLKEHRQSDANNGRLALTPFNVPPGSEASATVAWPPKPTWKARTVGQTT